MPISVQFRFSLGKKDLVIYKDVFMENFWNYKNYFDFDLK
jgi:hypothetical protein